MKDIKLVAIDIDGTLVDDNLKVSKNTIEIIKNLKRRDIEVSLVTGRAPGGAKMIMDQIGISLPTICHNGGIVTMEDGREIRNQKFSIDSIKEVLDYGEKNELYMKAFIDDLFYVEMDNEITKRFSKRFGVNYKVVDRFSKDMIDDINLLIIYFEDNIAVRELDRFKDLDIGITMSIPRAIEFIPKGVSKGEGVKQLKKQFGIKREDVLAIGNSLNDLSMLEFAGHGIAMKNSDDILLKSFDKVSDFTNNEEGVYHILKNI